MSLLKQFPRVAGSVDWGGRLKHSPENNREWDNVDNIDLIKAVWVTARPGGDSDTCIYHETSQLKK